MSNQVASNQSSEKARRLYIDGWSQAQIADQLGLTTRVVRRLIHLNGRVEERHRRRTPSMVTRAKITEAKARAIRKSGLAVVELADRYGISSRQVRRIIRGDAWSDVE